MAWLGFFCRIRIYFNAKSSQQIKMYADSTSEQQTAKASKRASVLQPFDGNSKLLQGHSSERQLTARQLQTHLDWIDWADQLADSVNLLSFFLTGVQTKCILMVINLN